MLKCVQLLQLSKMRHCKENFNYLNDSAVSAINFNNYFCIWTKKCHLVIICDDRTNYILVGPNKDIFKVVKYPHCYRLYAFKVVPSQN